MDWRGQGLFGDAMKPAFSYYGGKQKIAKRIVELLPEHKCYVEPFCGGAAVLFAKPPSFNEVLNDTNGRIVNFFKVLRDQPDNLIRKIQLTPYSRREHYDARNVSADNVDDARRWYCDVQQGFLNKPRSGWLATPAANCAKKVKMSADRLADVAQRVASVHVENVDAEKCIKQWDSKDTLFYVDPPYPSTDQGHYRGFSQGDFERLIEQLSGIKGRAVLSCYPNDAVPKSWQRVEIKTNCSASSRATGNREPRVECVWITP